MKVYRRTRKYSTVHVLQAGTVFIVSSNGWLRGALGGRHSGKHIEECPFITLQFSSLSYMKARS